MARTRESVRVGSNFLTGSVTALLFLQIKCTVFNISFDGDQVTGHRTLTYIEMQCADDSYIKKSLFHKVRVLK